MLKAEVFNIGIQEKGTPQGGILSPLLANVVLNELDWWLESKKALGIYFVRYADDVRILCPTYSIARNMLGKTTRWLNKRLHLEVSEEKTKIVNLKRNSMSFLGCTIKVKIKNGKPKIVSHIAEDRLIKCKTKAKKQIRKIKRYKSNPQKCLKEVNLYNSIAAGIHNYYDMNTKVQEDLWKIGKIINRYIKTNLSDVLTFSDKVIKNDFITNKYGKGKPLPYIRGKPLIPIERIEFKSIHFRNQSINYFDEYDRKRIHKNLKIINLFILTKLVNKPLYGKSVELNDIIISKFCGNLGKYSISNKLILDIKNLYVTKINNKKDYKYDNILLVEEQVKNLIELRECDDMVILSRLTEGLTRLQLKKINIIRKENSLPLISY